MPTPRLLVCRCLRVSILTDSDSPVRRWPRFMLYFIMGFPPYFFFLTFRPANSPVHVGFIFCPGGLSAHHLRPAFFVLVAMRRPLFYRLLGRSRTFCSSLPLNPMDSWVNPFCPPPQRGACWRLPPPASPFWTAPSRPLLDYSPAPEPSYDSRMAAATSIYFYAFPSPPMLNPAAIAVFFFSFL